MCISNENEKTNYPFYTYNIYNALTKTVVTETGFLIYLQFINTNRYNYNHIIFNTFAVDDALWRHFDCFQVWMKP